MIPKFILFLFGVLVYTTTLAQNNGKVEINYSDPFQIDSSQYFIIPKLIDKENEAAYGKGKGFFPWSSYSDVYFYDALTNQTKKLFGTQLALIVPFNPTRYYREPQPETPVNFLKRHVVYLARTENFNKDNGLDSDDPIYIYISTLAGDSLTQVTPNGMNVLSWTLSKDKKFVLVKLQQDKNGNRKFGNGDDEVYYRFDLHDEISKIKCYPVVL